MAATIPSLPDSVTPRAVVHAVFTAGGKPWIPAGSADPRQRTEAAGDHAQFTAWHWSDHLTRTHN